MPVMKLTIKEAEKKRRESKRKERRRYDTSKDVGRVGNRNARKLMIQLERDERRERR